MRCQARIFSELAGIAYRAGHINDIIPIQSWRRLGAAARRRRSNGRRQRRPRRCCLAAGRRASTILSSRFLQLGATIIGFLATGQGLHLLLPNGAVLSHALLGFGVGHQAIEIRPRVEMTKTGSYGLRCEVPARDPLAAPVSHWSLSSVRASRHL